MSQQLPSLVQLRAARREPDERGLADFEVCLALGLRPENVYGSVFLVPDGYALVPSNPRREFQGREPRIP